MAKDLLHTGPPGREQELWIGWMMGKCPVCGFDRSIQIIGCLETVNEQPPHVRKIRLKLHTHAKVVCGISPALLVIALSRYVKVKLWHARKALQYVFDPAFRQLHRTMRGFHLVSHLAPTGQSFTIHVLAQDGKATLIGGEMSIAVKQLHDARRILCHSNDGICGSLVTDLQKALRRFES